MVVWFYMMFDEGVNYTILANNADKGFMSKLGNFPIIEGNFSYEKLKEKLEMFPNKRLIFKNSLYGLKREEKKEIINLLSKQNINFVNVTCDVEESLLSDYIIVYDEDKKVLEGNMESVLRNEKVLKKLGFGVPFVVDLSIQLNYYDVLKKVYFDLDELVGVLWN
jgi:hypothetical protein